MVFPISVLAYIDMPYAMGCCCVSLCAARNIVRYQYRIGGEDCFDDYCFPWLVGAALYCASYCVCPLICGIPCMISSYYVAVVMKILKESDIQLQSRGGVPGHYLSSRPTSNESAVVTASAQYVPVATSLEVDRNHPYATAPTKNYV